MYFEKNQIARIAADLFDPIENLKNADFTKNVCIDSQGDSSEKLKALVIEFREKCEPKRNCKIEKWIYMTDPYVCTFEDIKVVNSVTFVAAFHGVHLDGKTNNDVDAITIQNAPELSFFPKRFNTIFTNIRAITIANTGLKTITAEDLRPFPELTNVYLTSNKLTKIEPRLFAFNPKLGTLDLSYNQIKTIPSDFFEPIPLLKVASFKDNICVQMNVRTFDEVKALKNEILKNC